MYLGNQKNKQEVKSLQSSVSITYANGRYR